MWNGCRRVKEYLSKRIYWGAGEAFTISIITSLGLIFVTSLIASDLRMSTLIKYYDCKNFLGFSLVVYGIKPIFGRNLFRRTGRLCYRQFRLKEIYQYKNREEFKGK
nr:hypothetical protein [Anaerococcus marasmi]